MPGTLRLELTGPLLRGLKPLPKGERLMVQDTREPRLFLRVTSTGRCSWSMRGYLPNGQLVHPTLGDWLPLRQISGSNHDSLARCRAAAMQERDREGG